MGLFDGPQLSRVEAAVANLTTLVTEALADLAALKTGATQAMALLNDLQAADTALQAAVANAVNLIKTLQANPATVPDTEVQQVVNDMVAAATNLTAVAPAPEPPPAS